MAAQRPLCEVRRIFKVRKGSHRGRHDDLFASPISSASMNPARTLGPDIAGSDYTGWWIHIAGPIIAAAIAVAIIGALRGLPDKQEREAAQSGALPILGSPKGPEIKEAP